MAKIQTIKNKDNVIIYPQTHSTAVFTSGGEKLQDKLNQYLTAEDVNQIDEVNLDAERQANKVLEVNENSTDTTYPSSKAVYDAIIVNKEVGVKIEIFATRDEIINPDEKTIYLIGDESPYEEYLYLGNNNWELIGTTQIDLSNYLTTTIADGKYAKLSLYSDTTINVGRKANTTIGFNSVAEGIDTTASGHQSHAEGVTTTAQGNYSHAEGLSATASGDGSHAEGASTTASGARSHAEGEHTTASGDYSHAEGYWTTAKGMYSHAEGRNATANGTYSHAEGAHTIAEGKYSHAEGENTTANSDYSHAEGRWTTASSSCQHVQGKCNVIDSNETYAHIVGNGSSDSLRSNAHTLDWNGNAWFEGDVYIGSTSGTNKDEGSKKLATEEYVGVNAMPASSVINAFWKGTQASYDALETYDNTTMYIIDNSNIITFTINDTERQAETGMTWAEWVESPYNPYPSDTITIEDIESNSLGTIRKNYYVAYTDEEKYPYAGYFVEAPDGRALHVIYNGGNYTYSTEAIIAGANYTHSTSCCVVAGTSILTSLEGDSKPIESIQPGDFVVSYNPKTQEQYLTQVDKLIINENSIEMVDLTLENGYSICMTDYHPVYTKTGFHSLTDKQYELLTMDDEVLTNEGWSKIVSINRYNIPERITTYTLALRDINELVDNDIVDNYYANGIVVHNAPCIGEWTYPTTTA